MTNNYMSRPIEPFAVPARVLRTGNGNDPPVPPAPPRTGAHDSGGPGGPLNFNFELVDLAAGAFFFALYLLCRTDIMASAAASVALLAVLFYRLSPRGRAIAGPVLGISTLMLVAAISSYALAPVDARALLHATPEELSMPAIVAAVVFFTRVRCYTLHILTGLGAAMLVSGLLPGLGWMAVFVAARYLVFFAVVFGLFMDYVSSPNHKSAPIAPPIAPPIAG